MNKKLTFLLALTFLFLFSGSVCGDNFQDGLDAYKKKDYKTAHKLWLPLAEQGFRYAQHALGQLYEDGEGVPQDDKEAVKWFRLSAEQGSHAAQESLMRHGIYPEFLFKEDRRITSKKNIYNAVKPSHESYQNKSYNPLNVPFTKLDYISIELDHEMSALKNIWTDYAYEHFEISSVCDDIEGWDKLVCYFKDFVRQDPPLDIHIDLRYVDELKEVQFAVLFSGLGKPKKSMKSFCSQILETFEYDFITESSGFRHSFSRSTRRFPEVSSIPPGTLHNFYVKATSEFQLSKITYSSFAMECIKTGLNSEIIYNKQSFIEISD